jgi:hypothetical protein
MLLVVFDPVADDLHQLFIKGYFIMGIMIVMMIVGHGLAPFFIGHRFSQIFAGLKSTVPYFFVTKKQNSIQINRFLQFISATVKDETGGGYPAIGRLIRCPE